MTKQEIINKVTKQTGIDREDVYLLFEAFIQTIQAVSYTHLTLPTILLV